MGRIRPRGHRRPQVEKRPILTKFTPLKTFLTKVVSINLTEIIFQIFRETFFLPHSPNFDL